MNGRTLLVVLIGASLLVTACGSSTGSPAGTATAFATVLATVAETSTAAAFPSSTASPSPIATEPAPPPTARPTASPPPTDTATALPPSATPTPAETATPEVTPTYTKLRARVTIRQAVCHYGPGAPYLYKYGVYEGSNIELLRRVEGGNYVEMQAIGGSNPCWVRVDYFEIKGNWLDLEPVRFDQVRLPITPYYASPGGVSARRDGNQVTIAWNPLYLDPGNSSEQTPYIIEAWVCQGGKNVFVPAGTYQTSVSITDEPGCAEPSYGYFVAAEKHGYTPRVKVPWPAP